MLPLLPGQRDRATGAVFLPPDDIPWVAMKRFGISFVTCAGVAAIVLLGLRADRGSHPAIAAPVSA